MALSDCSPRCAAGAHVADRTHPRPHRAELEAADPDRTADLPRPDLTATSPPAPDPADVGSQDVATALRRRVQPLEEPGVLVPPEHVPPPTPEQEAELIERLAATNPGDPVLAPSQRAEQAARVAVLGLGTLVERQAFRDAVLDLVPLADRVLPRPVEGWCWATAVEHTLPGSRGVAHLVPQGFQHPNMLRSWCGEEPVAWVQIAHAEAFRWPACPRCLGEGVRS